MVILKDLYSSLEGERESETVTKRRRPVRREEILLVTIREQRCVGEPIETKYFKFRLLILLGSSGI